MRRDHPGALGDSRARGWVATNRVDECHQCRFRGRGDDTIDSSDRVCVLGPGAQLQMGAREMRGDRGRRSRDERREQGRGVANVECDHHVGALERIRQAGGVQWMARGEAQPHATVDDRRADKLRQLRERRERQRRFRVPGDEDRCSCGAKHVGEPGDVFGGRSRRRRHGIAARAGRIDIAEELGFLQFGVVTKVHRSCWCNHRGVPTPRKGLGHRRQIVGFVVPFDVVTNELRLDARAVHPVDPGPTRCS